MTKISLVTASYNHSRFLPDYFKGLLSLTQRPDEIVFVDDGSTDNSVEIVESYQKKIPEIILFKNEKNRGVNYTFDFAVRHTKNDIISTCAVDDFFQPSFFEKTSSMFDKHPDLALVFTDLVCFQNHDPNKSRRLFFYPSDVPVIFSPEKLMQVCKDHPAFCVPGSGIVWNKKILLRYGSLDPHLMSIADYYLNAQIAFRHCIGYIPEPLAYFRLVETSYGHSLRSNWRKRLKIVHNLMNKLWKFEDADFRKKMVKSGYLAWNGYFLILYMLLNPYYWRHLPLIAYQVMKRKLCMRQPAWD